MIEQTIGIVGGGIVGLAIGREIARRRPGTSITVFEKEDRLAAHQTGHNSGVVHAGIYYQPGSLKARAVHPGRAVAAGLLRGPGLPYEECGKLVVAVADRDGVRLDALADRPARTRCRACGGWRRPRSREIEPYAAGLAALHSPGTAITDYVAVARRSPRHRCGRRANPAVHPVTGVTSRRRRSSSVPRAASSRWTGWWSAPGCRPIGVPLRRRSGRAADRAVPGRVHAVSEEKRDLVRGMIYPVPDPRYPFLGVHFTRRVSGELEVGPNAVFALSARATAARSVSPAT